MARAMLKEGLSPSQEGVNIIRRQNCVKSHRARRKLPRLTIYYSPGNAMTGQSSSQAASPVQWWKPALFFLVVIIGLWYVKWQPYYGKAFTAAETHSIGKSILAQLIPARFRRRGITPWSISLPSGKPRYWASCWAR